MILWWKVNFVRIQNMSYFFWSDPNWNLQDCFIEIGLFWRTRSLKLTSVFEVKRASKIILLCYYHSNIVIYLHFYLNMSDEAMNGLFAKIWLIVIKQLCSLNGLNIFWILTKFLFYCCITLFWWVVMSIHIYVIAIIKWIDTFEWSTLYL